jgi:hypothetical protein
LVDQRIRQQNKGQLIQFTVTVIYDDASSILLNSLDDFINYREVRPQISISTDLSWTYLIHFEDKPIPEKQIIELSISTYRGGKNFDPLIFPFEHRLREFNSTFKIRIQHTARSWGVDIEHLLIGQIKSWVRNEPWIKRIIYQNPGRVGLFFGIVFIVLGAWGCNEAIEQVRNSLIGAAEVAKNLSTEQKLDYLISSSFDSPALKLSNYTTNGYGGSFFAGILIGVIITVLADNAPQSYLVLSEKAKIERAESLKQRTRGWVYFLVSGITATIAGILSRYLFAVFFTG